MNISRYGGGNRRQETDTRTDPEDPYGDIIGLPHHQSPTRKHMTVQERAAQFSPFAALTGYEGALQETARLTGEMPELSEDQRTELDHQIQRILERIAEQPEVSVVYFAPDDRKAGGSCVEKTGKARRVDDSGRSLVFMDGTEVAVDYILSIRVL